MTVLTNVERAPGFSDASVHAVRNDDDAFECRAWIADNKDTLIAFDTETSGLQYHADVRLVQISDHKDAFVFDPKENHHLIEILFGGDLGNFVAHNAVFDCMHIGRLLHPNDNAGAANAADRILSKTTDTQLLATLLDPRGRKDGGDHSLKGLSEQLVNPNAPDSQKVLLDRFKELGMNKTEGFARIDQWDPALYLYAGADPLMTRRLHDVLKPQVDALDVPFLLELDHKVLHVLQGMTARGFQIDREYGSSLLEELYDEITLAERAALLYGVENINSGAQVAEALLAQGIELKERTATDKFKMDENVLSKIDHPLAALVREGKFARKMANTWVEKILVASHVDGRLHARFNAAGAITGRMTADHGLQTLPANDHRIRSMFTTDDDKVIAQLDFANIELRVAAAYSGEPKMVEAFANGDDLHSLLASHLFGEKFTNEDRKRAKATHFCWLYSGGPSALAKNCGITTTEAKTLLERQKRLYPRLTNWNYQNQERLEYGGGKVKTNTGRQIPIKKRREFYKATNYLVQSTAADLFLRQMIKVWELLKDKESQIAFCLHDSLVIDLAEEDQVLVHEIKEEFANTELGTFKVNAFGGKNFGEMKRMNVR